MAFNPGPFLNLNGERWTSTTLPGDTTKAMAQDFVDGGQNPVAKIRQCGSWAVRDAGEINITPETPLLYGVVSQGDNAGAFIRIDTQNGAVQIIGQTGFTETCGLTFDRIRGKLYLSPCFGQAGIQVVDITTGVTTPLGTLAAGVYSIAHRPNDDRIYGYAWGPTLLSLDAPSGGSDVDIIGMIDKRSVAGIAARPSDGKLFGVGITETNIQQLFKINHIAGSGPRDSNIGTIAGAPIFAITFHPDGRLFATTGIRLLTLDPGSGAILSNVPFIGASIGRVSALAITEPIIPAHPDVWIRDCLADNGEVPSSISCSKWWNSPDIMIDNNNDGHRDPVVYGQTNIVKIIVRNRGLAPAIGAVVRLFDYRKESILPNSQIPRVILVGQRIVDIPAGIHNTAKVSFPWLASKPAGSIRGLAVVLDHPGDRVNATILPQLDNNKAIYSFEKRPVLWPR
jgi:hypothetical protein